MVFSSCFFVFAFLPITYILYMLAPNIRIKNAVLIITSIAFYSFGEPVYVLLMLGSILFNYLLALWIAACTKNAKPVMILSVVVNIGLLVVFKYSAFLIQCINAVTKAAIPVPEISLPIGISFYTFQALSYCIDVYRDPKIVQKNPFHVMLYISFFPQLIAGPIVKYHDIEMQLADRKVSLELASDGCVRFIFGLAKKLFIANAMAAVVDTLYATDVDMALTAWLIAICYALQIYFDFSGYSDMAVGLGRMFGFEFKENFNYPYISGSIKEFWRRWHISLSTWFKEYLYIPLGGNRKGEARTILNKLIVFVCTGIWHGANLTFLVWGLFHGLFLILEYKALIPLKNKVFSHVYTMLVVVTGFVIFRADSLRDAVHIIASMWTGFVWKTSEWVHIVNVMSPYAIICLILGVLFSAPVSRRVLADDKLRYIVASVLYIACIVNLAGDSYNPFIYFRF